MPPGSRGREVGEVIVDVEERGTGNVPGGVELAPATRAPELPAAVDDLRPHPAPTLLGDCAPSPSGSTTRRGMHRRIWVALGVTSAVAGAALSAGSASAYFWDQSRSDMIAKGVSIAGIDVGGLRADDAQTKLENELERRLPRPVDVVFGDRRFPLRPASAGLQVDVTHMVDNALAASRDGGLAHRVIRDLRGKQVAARIPLTAAVSPGHVATFVRHVAKVIDRPAHDALVEPTPLATALRVVPSKAGVAVKQPLLEQRITNALLRIDGRTNVAVPTHAVAPHWWTSTLKKRFGTYLLVSRETFTLRLYKNLKLAKTYGIAVGQAGLETPAGL